MKINKFILFYISILCILVTGFYLRTLFYLNFSQLWGDEAAILIPAIKFSFVKAMFIPYGTDATSPPLYTAIIKILYNIGGINELKLRLGSYLAGLVSLPLCYLLFKRFLKGEQSLIIATFLISTNIALITMSGMIKQYTLDFLIATVILLIASNISWTQLKYKTIFLFFISALFFYISSFGALFIIPSIVLVYFISAILEKNKENIKKITLFTILNLIFLIPYYIFYLSKLNNDSHLVSQWIDKYGFFPNTYFEVSGIVDYLFDTASYFGHTNILVIISICTLLTIGSCIFYKVKPHKDFFVIVTPIIVMLIAGALKIYPFQNRAIIFLLPNFVIIIGMAFENICCNPKHRSLCNFIKNLFLYALLSLYFSNSNVLNINYYMIKNNIIINKLESLSELIGTTSKLVKTSDDKIIVDTDLTLQSMAYNYKYKIPSEQIIYFHNVFEHSSFEPEQIKDYIKKPSSIFYIHSIMPLDDPKRTSEMLSILKKECKQTTTLKNGNYMITKCNTE